MRRPDPLTQMGILEPIRFASRVLPRRVQRWIVLLLAPPLYVILGGARRAVEENLRCVRGTSPPPREIRRLAVRTFRNYGQYLFDYLALTHLGRDKLSGLVGRVDGEGHLERALEKGSGVVLATPHLGNWELGGVLLAARGMEVCVATAPEPDRRVLALRERMRRRNGVRTVTLEVEDGALTLLPLVAALRRNEVVALLGDREPFGTTVDVPFFDRPTPFPVGPALLARTSGAPIVPVYVTIESDWTYNALAEEPIFVARTRNRLGDIQEATARLAARFEVQIARHPDQWYNFFHFWPEGGARQGGSGRNPF